MAMRWYHIKYPGGTVTEKGRSEAEAKSAAADRVNCDPDEMVCTGHDPFGSQHVPPAEYKRG